MYFSSCFRIESDAPKCSYSQLIYLHQEIFRLTIVPMNIMQENPNAGSKGITEGSRLSNQWSPLF